MRYKLRAHPPTFAGTAAALVASLAQDVRPVLADLPVIGDGTATLATVLAAGVLGGLLGRLAERWTVPWRHHTVNRAEHRKRGAD